MRGHILEDTPICVDYWLSTPKKKYYHFLSHLQIDQTFNLSSTFQEIIYTSPLNAWLVKRWFQFPSEQVVPLPVNEPHIIHDDDIIFTVTLLDADHCPGSVMFLFEGSFGNILYTGDFRYNPAVLKSPMLKSLIDNQSVHELYLDNTYAAEHCRFPSRDEALKQVLDLVTMHPDHYLVIGDRKIGMEEVLIAIAKELKEKVLVSDERMAILKQLQIEDFFTTNAQESRIVTKEMNLITGNYLDKLKEEKGPVLAVLLTALHSVISSNQSKSESKEDNLMGVHRIPYSSHSSHQELVEFVSKVRPHKIHPIICLTKATKKTRQKRFDDDILQLSCAWNNSVIPESIMKLCLSESNGSQILKKRQRDHFKASAKVSPIPITDDIPNDAPGVHSSQLTDDLSNDAPIVENSQLTEDLLNEASKVKISQSTKSLSNDECIVGISQLTEDVSNDAFKEPSSQPFEDASSPINTGLASNFDQTFLLSVDTVITYSEEGRILDQLKELNEQSDSQNLKEDYISLSQEDLTQIGAQSSTQNHPNYDLAIEKIDDITSNQRIEGETKLQPENSQENEVQHNTVDVVIKPVSDLNLETSEDIQNSNINNAISEELLTSIDNSRETRCQIRPEKRKSDESNKHGDSWVLPQTSDIIPTVRAFEEINKSSEKHKIKKLKRSQSTPIKASNAHYSETSYSAESEMSKDSTSNMSLKYSSSNNSNENVSDYCCQAINFVSTNEESKQERIQALDFERSEKKYVQDKNLSSPSRDTLKTCFPSSEVGGDSIYTLAKKCYFYQDQLSKIFGMKVSAAAVSFLANSEHIYAQWNKAIAERDKAHLDNDSQQQN